MKAKIKGVKEDIANPEEVNAEINDAEIDEELAASEPTPEEIVERDLYEFSELIQDIQGAPDYTTLVNWRAAHGVLNISSVLDNKDFYIWRVLKRIEYKQMIKAKINTDPIAFDEAVIRRCLLWPAPDTGWTANAPAGAISTVAAQIKYQSGFVSDQQAISLIRLI